ncbi:hypothetical protein Acr_00g0086280 [Actinidia rufa]|uniref:Uncharacterized protein n=1 Tax=Actinidia rufa TaxID=165716 RepID=A0A7J0DVP5_9ERIC|nr:hypothetical protein Acr_00g0086280 [Actinidia rufa]
MSVAKIYIFTVQGVDTSVDTNHQCPNFSNSPFKGVNTNNLATTPATEEGTSGNPDAILGLKTSILENPIVAKKLLKGVVPPLDKEEVVDKLKKTKEDGDATVARLEAKVTELKEKSAMAKKLAIKEYKSSDDFQETVEFMASKYFGKGFDFCKRQIGHLHPDLDIQDMRIDTDLLEEEEDKEEEKEKEKEDREKGDTSPFLLKYL